MKELRDRVAVVTGAASGIGRAMAEHFAAEGMKVVLADIERNALDEAAAAFQASGATVLAVRCDVSKGADVRALANRAVDEFGAIHVVCNNAGVVPPAGPVWERTEADWDWVLGVNLRGVIHGVRTFVPIMIEQGTAGHIVNTASLAGLVSVPWLGIYNVSKHAVVTLSETLYRELAVIGSQVKVSVLCPAWVATRLGDADRNRPAELQNPERERTAQEEAIDQAVRGFLEAGISTEQVATAVVEAVKEEKLYILTHPESVDAVRGRMEDIVENRNPSAIAVF
jgi:NAD(P)-dependent dehydrogenase (short-subunit alcohol dehydrogenase family)